MTADNETNEIAELNVFVRTPEGYEAHVKLAAVPYSKVVKHLAALSETLDAAGMHPSAKNGSGQNGTGPACPDHPGKTKPSQHEPGGYYCAARVGDGYCSWKSSPKKNGRRPRS